MRETLFNQESYENELLIHKKYSINQVFLSSTPLGVSYKVSDQVSLHKVGKGAIDLGLKKGS